MADKMNEENNSPEDSREEIQETESKQVAEETDLTVEEQLQKALQEKEENYDRWVRSAAELENFRKRANKEKDSTRQLALAGLVRNLLPAFDNLQRTIDASQNSANVDDLVQGVQMVRKQLEDSLAEHAIHKINALGEVFDPNFHEAVQQFASDEYDEMVIMQELEAGFMLGEYVIRPSKVIVSSGPADNSES